MTAKVFGHHNIQTLKEAFDKFFEILLSSVVPPDKQDISSSGELLVRLSDLVCLRYHEVMTNEHIFFLL